MKIKISLLVLLLNITLFANTIEAMQIDPDKKMIGVSNASTYKKAVAITNKLTQYDRYIYKYTNDKKTQTYYLIYIANIKNKLERDIELKKLHTKFKSAYAISNASIKRMSKRTLDDKNFFKKEYNTVKKETMLNKQIKVSEPKRTIKPKKVHVYTEMQTPKKLKAYKKLKKYSPHGSTPKENVVLVYQTKSDIENATIFNQIKKANPVQVVDKMESKPDTAVQKEKAPVYPSELSKDRKYFVGLALGGNILNVKRKGDDITLSSKPDEEGLNVSLDLGYNFSNTSLIKLTLQAQDYEDIALYNNLISYNISHNNLPNLYVGIGLGVSFIKITKTANGSKASDSLGSVFTYGGEVAYKHILNDKFSLIAQYQYLKAKHDTKVTLGNETLTISRNDHQNITFGLRYNF